MSSVEGWAGRRLGAYLIEDQIGRGGMGVVYRAEQITLGRKVALKVIAPELAQEPAFRDRFRRESRLAAAIDHPNIIPVYEAAIAGDDLLYIAMRYVEGTDLHAIVHQNGPLDARRASGIVVQVASALDAAHSRQLVHRDVKPANVLIAGTSPVEHAYLTDFGLTKHMTSDSALTETGQWVGTLDFVAPEQIMGEPLDGRADVYSLGCVFYECLTGQPPFPRDVDVAKIYAHLNEPPPRVTDVLPELSPDFDSVVARALAKRREDRYSSAGELGRAISDLVAPRRRAARSDASEAATPALATEPPVPSHDHSRPEPTPVLPTPAAHAAAPLAGKPGRSRAALIAVGILLLGLGAIAGIAAASGLFDGGATTTSTQAAETARTAPKKQTTSKRHRRPTAKTTPPADTPVAPVPRPAGLRPFQTGRDAGQEFAATYCETRSGSTLYCWTPNDGYTISLGVNDSVKLRLRGDEAANKRHVEPGFSLLALDHQRTGDGFTCVSRTSGLTCTNAAGHGWTLPRYKGLSQDF